MGGGMEDVKEAMKGATATQSTVATLQTLLGLETAISAAKTTKPAATGRQNAAATGKARPKAARSTASRTKQPQHVAVSEDVPKQLSPREKYALATETVNSGLRVLADAVKTLSNASRPIPGEAPSTPVPASRGALQPRSNNITPRRPSPEKTKASGKTVPETPSKTADGAPSHPTATAECTRMAFAFLRSADTQKMGVREMPRLQLETGMLALIGKLIPLGLESMAVKELRHVKRRLEILFGAKKDIKSGNAKSRPITVQPERETLASLLQLDVDFSEDAEALNLGATYCMHTMKIIALLQKPAVIEEVAQYLDLDRKNSPADLLRQQGRTGAQTAKVAKQLEALAQLITSLCPSPSSTSDAVATHPSKYSSPETVLKLQSAALQIRRCWWSLAQHQADIEKELLEPFSRCAMAFVRRSASAVDAGTMYTLLSEAFASVYSVETKDSKSAALFSIQSILLQQAECAGMLQEALECAETMIGACSKLEKSHARRLSAIARHRSLLLKTRRDDTPSLDFDGIVEGLESKLSGTAADFDNLLSSLHGFATSATACPSRDSATGTFRKVLVLAAGFALCYARSYPGRGTSHVTILLKSALLLSRTTDDLLSWVTAEAAIIFVQAGALKNVAEVARRWPLAKAWEASPDAIALSRISRALLLARVRSEHSRSGFGLIDDDKLPPEERGVLFERQLDSAMQLTSKTKYHATIRQIVSELLPLLAQVHTADAHPIRRGRVAVMAFRLQETCSELLPTDGLKEWQSSFDLDQNLLGHDAGLEPYLADLKAALSISKAFLEGCPAFDQLKPALQSWSRLIEGCADAADLRGKIDDPLALTRQLHMIASYLGMRGDEHARLPVLILLERLETLRGGEESDSRKNASIQLARCYLALGHSERAAQVLARVAATTGLEALQYRLVDAECSLSTDNLEECNSVLAECKTLRAALSPDKVGREQRRVYESLHAEAWLVHSKYVVESGSPHEALVAAKRSVKILNSMWAALERADGSRKSDKLQEENEAPAADTSVNELAKGVSKLQLTSKDETSNASKTLGVRGAEFWSLVPLLTKALMHLSDMYRHHGLFSEANYYSERAISIAESVGAKVLLSRIRSHRAHLLTLAGRLEEAELCLTQAEATDLQAPSLAAVERLCAEAAVRTKDGSLEEGFEKLQKAQHMIGEMLFENSIARIELLDDEDELAEKAATLSLADSKPTAVSRGTAKAPAKRPPAKPKAGKPAASKRAQTPASATARADGQYACYLLDKIKTDITVRLITLKLKLRHDIGDSLMQLTHTASSMSTSVKRNIAEHLRLMAEAYTALESDVTMNVLVESTLSLPSFQRTEKIARSNEERDVQPSSAVATKATVKSKKPAAKPKVAPQSHIVTALEAARRCLLQSADASFKHCGTAETHLRSALLSKASMLMSAVYDQECSTLVSPISESLGIDRPRMKAIEYERQAVRADNVTSTICEPLSWPAMIGNPDITTTTTTRFQEEYIDIIPKSWTAVSLCLNEDASELYIARYRSEQEPMIIRLPFSRHKPDDVDEEAFDYTKGKAELQDIIELSNYTCHSSRNMDAKGAKTTWWSDREALDRRMHELLINIESIWFGGFKSIFAQIQSDEELLARFRRSLEEVLDRYLPSRQAAAKLKSKKLVLDDKVLELFIGLGDDQDGVVDLDEPLADLLYFVVDMLQFSGERNAYDEIDFDSMAVDVLDSLRSYHEGLKGQASIDDRHLVLVLDRRLQAFPWENMPCLQGESVSRVGSMQSLRDCTVAMRSERSVEADRLPDKGESCHIIARTSGTYILNPSSDLKATQTMLSPALASLMDTSGQPWTSVVNEAPDEQRFSKALQDSSVLLYFGHGAGSQYIRPRAIKRLESCSEVVWLMGCSSGAVTENGDLEPSAVPHAYLLAGGSQDNHTDSSEKKATSSKCLSVLATLWDVTDKDIDRFSLSVGEAWGLFPPSADSKLPAKTPKKRPWRQIVAPSTPQQVPKTPKTPKARKTPAPAKTPGRGMIRSTSGGRERDGKKRSLVQAVASSRDVCYLRYLNGAAAVVYGVPVYLGD